MLTEGMDLLAQPNPKYRSLLFVTIAHYILATNLAIFDSGLALRLSLTLLLHEAYTHKANLSNDICKKGYLPSLILQSSPFELQLFRHVRQTRRAEMSVHFDPSLQQRARDMMGCFSLCTTDCCCCCSAWQVQLRRKRLPNGWSRPLHLRPPARAAAPCEIQIGKDDDTPFANKKERHSLIPASQRERTGVAETRTIKVCALCKRVVHAYFTDEELADHLSTLEALKSALEDVGWFQYVFTCNAFATI